MSPKYRKSERAMSEIKVLRHPETNEVIWLEAEPVLDLLEKWTAGGCREELGAEANFHRVGPRSSSSCGAS